MVFPDLSEVKGKNKNILRTRIKENDGLMGTINSLWIFSDTFLHCKVVKQATNVKRIRFILFRVLITDFTREAVEVRPT